MTVKHMNRTTAHHWAMLRTMVTQLLEHERIETTLPKAKQLREVADRVITYAKKGDKNGRNLAASVVRTERELHKLLTTMAERYRHRPGGYTRIVQLGRRQHDAAPMAYIEYVDRPGEMRPARPPPASLLPRAAQAAQQQSQQQQSAQSSQQQATQQQQQQGLSR